MAERIYNLEDRLLEYATQIIGVTERLKKSRAGRHVADQTAQKNVVREPCSEPYRLSTSMLDVERSMFDVQSSGEAASP